MAVLVFVDFVQNALEKRKNIFIKYHVVLTL